MKTNTKTTQFSIINQTLVIVITAFLSFSIMAQGPSEIRSSKESFDYIVRINHAKELLGRHYKQSIVKKTEKIRENQEVIIYNLVRQSLRKKDKHRFKIIADTIIQESLKYEFDPFFLMAVIQNESGFRPRIIGGVGEIGLMQIKPTTAAWIAKKINYNWEGRKALFNPVHNIKIGAAYLDYLRTKFDSHGRLYLSAYNMGARNVKNALKRKIWPRDYVYAVMKRYVAFYSKI